MSLSLSARPSLLWIVRVLSFSALAVCLWLFARKLSGDINSLAGCGAGDECEQVMGSAWSEWFHIPVTLLAAFLYLGVLLLTIPSVQRVLGRTGDQLLAANGVTLLAAAAYFVGILLFKLEKKCPWCFTLHLTGVVTGGIILMDAFSKRRTGERGVLGAASLTGFMAMCVLVAGQVWGPKPATYEMMNLTYLNDSLKFDPTKLPILGKPDAKIVLVEFFDYTCTSCRNLAGDLRALKRKWPDTFAVIALPSPLSRNCNAYLKPGVPEHVGACDLARLSLTLWRAKPAAFQDFHDYLLSIPLPVTLDKVALARLKADELAGAEAMATASKDEWVARQIESNAKTLGRLTEGSIAMPKLLFPSPAPAKGESRTSGNLPNTSGLITEGGMTGTTRTTEEFIFLMERQFKLR